MRGGTRQAIKVDGVILHLRNYGESDRIVELLGRGEGRIALIARGARASKKRFAGKLDLFVSLKAQVIPRGNLWTLQGADLVDARVGIRSSWEAIARATLLVDCTRALTPERLEADDCLAALEQGLNSIAAGDLAGAVSVLPQLLHAAGWMPDLDVCGQCGRRGAPMTTVDRSGALWCTHCAPHRPVLSTAAWEVLQGRACPDETVAAEVERWVVAVVESHRGRPLRSRQAQLR